MNRTTEIVTHFASITPLDHPEVITALLGRLPDYHDAVLRTFATHLQTRDQIRSDVGDLFNEAGLGEDFRAAILLGGGTSESPVRVWLNLSPKDHKVLGFFNFVPDWQKVVPVTDLVYRPPKSLNYTIVTHELRAALYVRGQSRELTRWSPQIQSYQLGMEPLMGLDRMVSEAAKAREAFFNINS